MPRVSAAALAVMEGNGIDTSSRRPAPPADLNPDEAKLWKTIVGAMSAVWFGPETHPNLKQLVRREVRARVIAAILYKLEKEGKTRTAEYHKWLRAEKDVTHDIAILQRQCRLSQGSTYRQEYTKKRKAVSKASNNGNGLHTFGV